jgi:hypothetical protein
MNANDFSLYPRKREILDLETWIRPPQFDELPPEVRELSAGYRAANPEGTQRWVVIEERRSVNCNGNCGQLPLEWMQPLIF